jgi:hypothetical protein
MRPAIDVWILLSSSLILTGWLLSISHQFTAQGYALWLGASALILAWYWRQFRSSAQTQIFSLARLRTRLRKFLPAAFLSLALLALTGGLLYEPNNHDGLSYRIPRVLHWLTHGSWFWTGNSDTRMDTRSVGFEFLSVPFLALLHTDRLIFLWNWTGFLFLPALIFQLSRRLGASGRVAWNWMWLAPSAYGIVLQAGSIGNDSIAGVFFLASLVLATGRQPVPFRDLAFSALAMAICAGIKSTNILWALPWLCVILPQTKTLLRRPWLTTSLLLVCLGLSSVPIWLSNQLRCGDWTGEKAEVTTSPEKPNTVANPTVGIVGNLILLGIQNSAPPVWPFVYQTTDFVRSSLPKPFVVSLSKSFEGGFQDLAIRELPQEEGAGLGLGLTILSFLALFAAIGTRPWKITPPSPALGIAWLATLVSILIYSSKMAIGCPARIILPALMFLIVGFSVLPNQCWLVRSRLWRWSAFFALASSILVLILTPSRPLVPHGIMVKLAQKLSLPLSLNKRIFNVYETYGRRARAFSPLLIAVSPGTRVLGYTGGVALEAALWKPYGDHSIIFVPPADLLKNPQCPHPELLIASAYTIKKSTGLEPLEWIRKTGASILAQKEIIFLVRNGPELFYLLKLPSSESASP